MANYSLGELEYMARNAVRGAGFHWGHAFEAANAVRWLEARSLPGGLALAQYLSINAEHTASVALSWRPGHLPGSAANRLCPILSASALVDHAKCLETQTKLGDVNTPLLLVPALHHIARLRDTVAVVRWGHDAGDVCTFAVSPLSHQVQLNGNVFTQTQGQDCYLTLDSSLPHHTSSGTRVHRGELKDWALALFTKLATRTRAPATKSSRARGAGATNDQEE